jgi:hypothetical protein
MPKSITAEHAQPVDVAKAARSTPGIPMIISHSAALLRKDKPTRPTTDRARSRTLEDDSARPSPGTVHCFNRRMWAVLEEYEKSRQPNSWSGISLLSRIQKLDSISEARRSSLIEAYRLYYSAASGFIHSSSALFLLNENVPGPAAIEMRTGRLPQGHYQPLILSVLFFGVFFTRFLGHRDGESRLRSVLRATWRVPAFGENLVVPTLQD